MEQLKRCVPVVFLCATLLGAAGCAVEWGGGSVGTSLNGRAIKASSDREGVSLTTQNGTALIRIAGNEVIVRQDWVLVNGKPAAEIPEDAKKIEIIDAKGTVDVTVDGVSVHSFSR